MTIMRTEIDEIPDAVDRLLIDGADDIRKAAHILREANPKYLLTIGRGTSDHAALFFKYAAELVLKRPVASIGPSISSIYETDLDLVGGACLAFSQSGMSPDIVSLTSAIAKAVPTFAITNNVKSDLAQSATLPIDMQAGPEIAVAATKTFISSCVAALMLVAEWSGDKEIARALRTLPGALDRAKNIRWPRLLSTLEGSNNLFVAGRGPSFAVAQEAALKCKETCQIHAEAYSTAELMHGPVEILTRKFPVIALTANDRAEQSVMECVQELSLRSDNVFATSRVENSLIVPLDIVRSGHGLTDPIAVAVSYYAFIEELSLLRGLDPDNPSSLKKVTETV